MEAFTPAKTAALPAVGPDARSWTAGAAAGRHCAPTAVAPSTGPCPRGAACSASRIATSSWPVVTAVAAAMGGVPGFDVNFGSMSTKDLLPRLDVPDLDSGELRMLLDNQFGTPSIYEKGLTYPGSTLEYALKLVHTGDVLKRLEPGPRFKESDLERLREAVQRELVDSPGQTIARSVALSAPWPVVGSFRATSGNFQLLPAPESAPRPPALHGEHPVILEFPVKRSTDSRITMVRRHRRDHEILLVLSALLRDSLNSTINSRPRNFWVYTDAWDDPSFSNRWMRASAQYAFIPFEFFQDE